VKRKTTEGQMPLSGTEEEEILARLSERVDRAVKMIQDLRRERDELKAQIESAGDHEAERSEIRSRIEKILANLDQI
jgi:FtsZ-binding cell division protein ZapB